VGVHACRRLAPHVAALRRDDLVVVEIGTALPDALHWLERADYVLGVDAMQGGGPPGSIYLCEAADLAVDGRPSLHQLGLLTALELLALEHGAGPSPPREGAPRQRWRRPRVEILGVEPESLGLGLGLSPAVEAALPRLLEQIWQRVTRWSGADRRG
jgi:hydrogenase maturation protease